MKRVNLDEKLLDLLKQLKEAIVELRIVLTKIIDDDLFTQEEVKKMLLDDFQEEEDVIEKLDKYFEEKDRSERIWDHV